MAIRLVYEALEIEKLLDEEKAAKDKGPIAEQDLEDKKVEQVIEDKKEEEGGDSSTPVDTPEDQPDSSEEDPGSTPPETEESTDVEPEVSPKADGEDKQEKESSEEEPEDKPKDSSEDDKPAQESLREIWGADLAIETFGENLKAATYKTVGAIFNFLQWAVGQIVGLTARHGPDILRAMYRGVIYALAKTIDGLNKTYQVIDKDIGRRRNSIETLKNRLGVVKQLISNIESRDEGVEDIAITYGNREIIDSLKSKDSTDFAKNLVVLDSFLKKTINGLSKLILGDMASIQRLTTMYASERHINPAELLQLDISSVGLSVGSVAGYDARSELLESYKSKDALPGDIVVIAEVPTQSIKTIEAYEAAYKDSRFYLGFDKINYHQVSDVRLEGFVYVKNLTAVLENLIQTYESQQTLYEDIRKTKPGLFLSIKKHTMNLVESNTKVRYDDSLVGPMYLKATFVAKVYLTGSLDIHDYAARTISNGLSLVEDLAKKYS